MNISFKNIAIATVATAIIFNLGCQYTSVKANNTLQSQGKIIYEQNGSQLVIDTADHELLQQQIDELSAKIENIEESGYPQSYEDVSSLIKPASGVTLTGLYAKKFGNEIYLTGSASWSTNTNSKTLFSIDESIKPITAIMSSSSVSHGGTHYFSALNLGSNNIVTAQIGVSTNALYIRAHWRTE